MSDADFGVIGLKVIAFAKGAVMEDGFVAPFGATISADGEFIPVKRIQPPDAADTAETLVNELLQTFRGLAASKRIRAVGWCVDVRVIPPGATEKTDAFIFHFESSDGQSQLLATPYRGAPGPTTEFAKPYSQVMPPRIFV